MAMSRAELQKIIASSIPDDFYAFSMRALVKANKRAKAQVATLAKAECRDVFGHIQRAHFQGLWRHSASDIPGATATVHLNAKKTAHFTEVRLGRVLLTESAVKTRGDLPRTAEFRNDRTLSSQTEIEEWIRKDGEPANDQNGDFIYGMLIHCTDKNYDLYDARIVIPDHSGHPLYQELLSSHLIDALEEDRDVASEEKISEPAAAGLRIDISADSSNKSAG